MRGIGAGINGQIAVQRRITEYPPRECSVAALNLDAGHRHDTSRPKQQLILEELYAICIRGTLDRAKTEAGTRPRRLPHRRLERRGWINHVDPDHRQLDLGQSQPCLFGIHPLKAKPAALGGAGDWIQRHELVINGPAARRQSNRRGRIQLVTAGQSPLINKRVSQVAGDADVRLTQRIILIDGRHRHVQRIRTRSSYLRRQPDL